MEGLYLKLHSMHCPGFASRQFHVLSSLANRTTEFIWQRTLPHLRALIPKKSGTPGNFIHTFADVTLRDFSRRVLSMGPKFAVAPRSTGPELVTYVRQVSRLADGADAERYLLSTVWMACENDAGHKLKLLPHRRLRDLDPNQSEKMNKELVKESRTDDVLETSFEGVFELCQEEEDSLEYFAGKLNGQSQLHQLSCFDGVFNFWWFIELFEEVRKTVSSH
ncbi:hypothetical protein HPB50_029634 [Hyalomma asiaticum]|nr:hypothetical protein HPB50_029634 [Hyalomma asiaticum]